MSAVRRCRPNQRSRYYLYFTIVRRGRGDFETVGKRSRMFHRNWLEIILGKKAFSLKRSWRFKPNSTSGPIEITMSIFWWPFTQHPDELYFPRIFIGGTPQWKLGEKEGYAAIRGPLAVEGNATKHIGLYVPKVWLQYTWVSRGKVVAHKRVTEPKCQYTVRFRYNNTFMRNRHYIELSIRISSLSNPNHRLNPVAENVYGPPNTPLSNDTCLESVRNGRPQHDAGLWSRASVLSAAIPRLLPNRLKPPQKLSVGTS